MPTCHRPGTPQRTAWVGSPDLELRDDACLRTAGGARRPGLGRGCGPPTDRQARGRTTATVDGGRRATRVRCRATARHRGYRGPDQPGAGQGETELDVIG